MLPQSARGEAVVQGSSATPSRGLWGAYRAAVTAFAVLAGVVSVGMAGNLWEWVRFASQSDLFSHGLIVPLISVYLVRLGRRNLPAGPRRSVTWAVLPAIAAMGLLAARRWLPAGEGSSVAVQDELFFVMGAWVCLIWSAGMAAFGPGVLRAVWFPAGFLVFAVPLPVAAVNAIETFFQYTSAEAAAWIMSAVGLPYFRTGLEFELPGVALRVAQECSGIHSSLVLFLTALLGGHLFLRSGWRRLVLALAVIPLGIVRNGFRVATLATLCVQVDPRMIDSPIHHQGGPIFFVLSLIPFSLLLWWLRRGERSASAGERVGR